MVNTPVFRGSTILSNSLTEWESRKLPGNPYASYGRFGTPTTRALETALAELEGGYRSIVFPSGLAACTHSLLALLKPGDHALISDSVYGPTRSFATTVLTRFGIDVAFFDPLAGGEIRGQIRPSTRVVFVESPGSTTFEVQDIPAIAEEAHKVDAFVVMDNTWATPLFFKPFEHGVDISVQAATKYIAGHSDVMQGVVVVDSPALAAKISTAHEALGLAIGADDAYLALRGLRTLPVRLAQHQRHATQVAQALEQHPHVARVFYPALASDPGHALWRRDFSGASGLVSFAFEHADADGANAFVDALKYFGIGASWGGYESLALVAQPERLREHSYWTAEQPVVRLHIGLEDPLDLIADLEQAFERVPVGAAVEAALA